MAKDAASNDVRRLEVLYESLQADVQKILDIVSTQQQSISKIPLIAERIEQLEYDASSVKLATTATSIDVRLIKSRTEKLEELVKQVKDQEERIAQLET